MNGNNDTTTPPYDLDRLANASGIIGAATLSASGEYDEINRSMSPAVQRFLKNALTTLDATEELEARVLVQGHAILVMRLDVDAGPAVGAVLPTGHAFAKSIRRFVWTCAGLPRSARKRQMRKPEPTRAPNAGPLSFHAAWGFASRREDYDKPAWEHAQALGRDREAHTFEEWLAIVANRSAPTSALEQQPSAS